MLEQVGPQHTAFKYILYNCIQSSIEATVWRKNTYRCDGQAPTNIWPYSENVAVRKIHHMSNNMFSLSNNTFKKKKIHLLWLLDFVERLLYKSMWMRFNYRNNDTLEWAHSYKPIIHFTAGTTVWAMLLYTQLRLQPYCNIKWYKCQILGHTFMYFSVKESPVSSYIPTGPGVSNSARKLVQQKNFVI